MFINQNQNSVFQQTQKLPKKVFKFWLAPHRIWLGRGFLIQTPLLSQILWGTGHHSCGLNSEKSSAAIWVKRGVEMKKRKSNKSSDNFFMKTKLSCFFLNLICSSFIKVSIKYEKLFFFRNWSLCIVSPVSDGHEWWESNWASCGLFSPAVLATVRRAYLRGGNTMKWSTSWRQRLPTHPIRYKLALINLPSPWPPSFVKPIWPKLDSKRAQPVLERKVM